MKFAAAIRRSPALLIAALLAAGTFAAPAGADDRAVRAMARDNGLTEREQRMLSGAPTAHSNYRTSYWQARDKLRRQMLADSGYYDRPVQHPVRVVRVAPPTPAPARPEPLDSAETYALPED